MTMSGYAGSDDEQVHAAILNENAIAAAREQLGGRVLTHCEECGEEIDPARVAFMVAMKMKCECCVHCQELRDREPKRRVKMLDNIL